MFTAIKNYFTRYKRQTAELKGLQSLFNDTYSERCKLEDHIAYNFRIRRAIIGMQGVGKTTFMVEKILPQCKNYLVFDGCKDKIYADIPSNNKYSGEDIDLERWDINFRKEFRRRMESKIATNPEKLFIFDGIHMEHDWFLKLLNKYDFNFIIISQTLKNILSYNYHIDYWYMFPIAEHYPSGWYAAHKPYVADLERYERQPIVE